MKEYYLIEDVPFWLRNDGVSNLILIITIKKYCEVFLKVHRSDSIDNVKCITNYANPCSKPSFLICNLNGIT